MPQAPEDHAAPGEPSAGGARPPFRPTQEIRFAVVLYGGVSLAIYINGVVQELLHLVRATAPEAPTGESPDAAWKSEAELTSTERVYRRLGQLLEWGKTPPPVLPGELAPIRTRFVVDILSGSSAGGINGVFLGKALANEQELAQLKQLWIDEGDIARLVNDKRSYDRLGLDEQRPPESVLNSRRLYWKLLAALDEMGTDGGAEASRLVDELDLWITTTDIRGLLMPIDLFDRMVYERRHRNVLHFKYATGYARGGGQGTDDGPVNDFLRSYNPMLAFAGRATSAFPFAFEPMTLSDIDQVLEVERFRHHAGGGAGSPRWRKFFEDYVRARRAPGDARGDDEYYRDEAFGDGGYLDNKPFTWATQAIARRRADLPVDRRLIYVEPDPGSLQPRVHPPGRPGTAPPPAWAPPERKPDPLENVVAAAISLPRTEPIRDDLEQLVVRNRQIDRIREIATLVDRTADEFPELTLEAPPTEIWRKQTLFDVLNKTRCGLGYVAYHRLKVAGVLDDLAEMATSTWGLSGDSDESSAVRCLIEAWFREHFPEEPSREGQLTQNEFLLRYDVRYRLRRLGFVDARIEELLRFDDDAWRLLERFVPDGRHVEREAERELDRALRGVKPALNELFVELRAAARQLRSASPDNPLRTSRLGLERADLLHLLDGATTREEAVERARELIGARALDGPLSALADGVERTLEPVFKDAGETVQALLDLDAPSGPETPIASVAELALRPLRHFYRRYDSYDQILLPLSYGVSDEADRVEVIRVSPQDAPSLIDETASSRRKLAGVELNHFGGFFERAWRRNDLMWGRLDAAERIIDTLLLVEAAPEESRPALHELRAKLLKDAQLAIIADELELDDRGPLTELMTRSLLSAGTPESGGASVDDLVAAESPDDLRAAMWSSLDAEAVWNHLRTDYEVRRELDRQRLLGTLGRATQVTGRLLDGVSGRYTLLKRPSRWLVRSGQVLWGLVETATPRSYAQLLFRYWLPLLTFMALLLIVGGALFGAPATAKAGWILLLIVLGWRLAVWLTEDVIHRRWRWGPVLLVVAVAAVAGLAALEVARHLSADLADLLAKLPNPVEDLIRRLWPWDDGGSG